MIDELKEVNQRLKKEKETLRKRNQELTFINRLSSEVAYDLNWDRILPRILDAGLLSVIDPEVFCLLYKIGSRWNLAFYLSEKEITKETILKLSENIIDRFFALSQKRIMTNEIDLHMYPSDVKVSPSPPISLSKSAFVEPLRIAEYLLGMLLLIPRGGRGIKNGTEEVLSTISNILAMSLKNAQEYHILRQMTVTDSLTSVYNHKGFREFIQREFKRAKRYNNLLSLIMVDIDNFKAINDSFGHQTGDYILQELAECLKCSVRNTDIVTRYGGDEFAVLLPEAGMKEAEVLVERIVHTLKNHTFQWGSELIQVEISFGISTIDELEKDEKVEALIHLADSRLYAAKRSRQTLHSISRGA
jgi:diguanylate cyclase (GGDEF)-like protein